MLGKMMKIDCIFIDLDGTLLDGKMKHYNCYKDIILKDGGSPIAEDIYWDMKRSKIKRDILLRKSDYKGTYESFMMQWLTSIESEEYLRYDELKPNVINVLNNWKNFTSKIILLTMRNNHESLYHQLDHFKIRNLFNKICECSENHEKYEYVKNIRFDRAIVIGDTEHDIDLARKLNVKCIAVTNGLREKEFLDADYFENEVENINIEKIIKEIY